jgi:hypothetical protein
VTAIGALHCRAAIWGLFMNDWTRGREHFSNLGPTQSPLWEAIDQLVSQQTKSRSFDDLSQCNGVQLDYQPSPSIKARYDLVDGHSRYKRDPEGEGATFPSDIPLGPVELDLLSFASSTEPAFLVLLGGMGSGKSTTIKYLNSKFWQDYKVKICNLDADSHLLQTDCSENIVMKKLVRYLSPEMDDLISPEEEITKMWTWAMCNDTNTHPAKNVLSDAQSKLRSTIGNTWRSESEAAIAVRKEALSKLHQDPFDNLDYQALRVDYYLSCRCAGDRSRFLLVLDNADPLPPRTQHYIFTYASRFQTASRCKMLVSLRPLTYSSNLQAANRLIEVVEHIGPSVIDVIRKRVEQKVLPRDLRKLTVTVNDEGRSYRPVQDAEARQWLQDIIRTISEVKPAGPKGEPNARSFIEGICGRSLRSALIVAPKIFGSPVAPPLPVGEATSQRQRVRDHDIIRAIVDGWHGYYQGDPKRVTDNIFDLGSNDSRSCTSKIRLLKKLMASHNKVITVGELRQHLAYFGYQDKLILDTVNNVMSQSKRLAWSDSVPYYETLDGYQNTRIQLSSAGEYYVEHAMFNLEYVQGVHVDVLLPRDQTLQHDPRKFADRLSSLELFIRYLHLQDLEEVKRMLRNPQEDYIDVYGTTLFSIDIVGALERQIRNVANALLRSGKTGKERREDITNTVDRWASLLVTIQTDSHPIEDKIASLRPSSRGATA